MFSLHKHVYTDIGVYYKSTFKLEGYFLSIYMLKSCICCGKYKETLIDKIYFDGSYSLNLFVDKNDLKTKIELLKHERVI